MTEPEKNPLQEIEAMKVIADALKPLAPEARGRVLKWVAEAFDTTFIGPAQSRAASSPSQAVPRSVTAGADRSGPVFESIADLFAAAQPTSDASKALVAAYWFQVLQQEQDFDSQSINTGLKHLGHGVSNITQALTTLMTRKPQLVIQTRKSGATQQARKRYKLTSSGQQEAERMIRTGGGFSEAPES